MGDDIWRAYFPSRADQCALLKDALASRNTSFLRHAMKVIARTQGVELVPGFLTDGSTFEDVVDWLDRLGFSLTVDCKRRIGERHETTKSQKQVAWRRVTLDGLCR